MLRYNDRCTTRNLLKITKMLNYESSSYSTYDKFTDSTPAFTDTKCTNYCEAFLRPCLSYMQFCGLYFTDTKDVNRNYWKVYSQLYAIMMWLMFTAAFIFALPTVYTIEYQPIVTLLVANFWTFQCCVNTVTCYNLASKGRIHRVLLKKWDAVYSWNNRCLTPFPRHTWALRNVLLLLTAIIDISNRIAWICLCFDFIPSEPGRKLFPIMTFIDPNTGYYLSRALGILVALSSPSWILPISFFALHCQCLYILFSINNARLRQVLKYSGVNPLANIEAYRILNESIIEMVEEADHIYGPLVLTQFLTKVTMIGISLYRILADCTTGVLKTVQVFWLAAEFTILIMMCWFCVAVNVVAHRSLSDLYAVPTVGFRTKTVLQMSLFINRLSSLSIGFTGCGFFLINKGFVMSVASGITTYLLLLLQFGTQSNRFTCTVNVTENYINATVFKLNSGPF